MKIAHILRKYQPEEWGGTETVIKNLCEGLKKEEINSIVFCPRINQQITFDPLLESGCEIRRFKAYMPVWGLTPQKKQQLVTFGGNLLSFDLLWMLLKEPHLSLIHTHAIHRLGAIAWVIAKLRRIPLVVTIHGGVFDLPKSAYQELTEPLKGGWEWGKVFGWLLQSRSLLRNADAILTCNCKEAELLKKKYPLQRVIVQPHAINMAPYQQNFRKAAQKAFPAIVNKQVLLVVARIHPIKNQSWMIDQMPRILKQYPDALLVLAGSCTDSCYREELAQKVVELHLENAVIFTDGIPSMDSRLIGLFQEAKVVIVPSLMEPFGLTILEAWAAGTPVIANCVSGPAKLIESGRNGWLFDLENKETFDEALRQVLENEDLTKKIIENARELVKAQYNNQLIVEQIKNLYVTLIDEKNG